MDEKVRGIEKFNVIANIYFLGYICIPLGVMEVKTPA